MFSDIEFNKARSVCSDTQLYKQAGNSIVVDVLMAIFARLFSSNKTKKTLVKTRIVRLNTTNLEDEEFYGDFS